MLPEKKHQANIDGSPSFSMRKTYFCSIYANSGPKPDCSASRKLTLFSRKRTFLITQDVAGAKKQKDEMEQSTVQKFAVKGVDRIR
jgi:hypothetical protein